MTNAATRVMIVYMGSDGEATKALYADLERLGPIGVVATNLFRAQKNSARAKVYRGGLRGQGSFKDMAYGRKQWALDNLAQTLTQHAEVCGIQWGWGVDAKQDYHRHVLYVDLPTGQVSFHTDRRGAGPDYPREWDGVRDASPTRVCNFVARVLNGAATPAPQPEDLTCPQT